MKDENESSKFLDQINATEKLKNPISEDYPSLTL